MFEKFYELGFSLVPYNGAQKHPKDVPNWQKYCYERASLDTLREWTKTNTRFGICCGPASNLVVFDTDTPEGEAWAETNLPPTPWMVKTGVKDNGFRGTHRYYRWPTGRKFGNGLPQVLKDAGMAAHVDVRAAGGQVVSPFTDHASGVYYAPTEWPWLPTDDVPTYPEWLIPDDKIESDKIDLSNRETVNLDAYEKAQKFLAKLDTPYPGERNKATFSAACGVLNLGCNVPEAEHLITQWVRSFPDPISDREAIKCVASAAKNGNEPVSNKPEWKPDPNHYKRQESTPTPTLPTNGFVHNTKLFEPAEVEADPVTGEILTDRQRIEWEYIVSAWEDSDSLTVLSSFGETRWQDRSARAFSKAIRELVGKAEDIDLVTIAQEMRAHGCIDAFRDLERFYDANGHKVKPKSSGAFTAFWRAVRWDEVGEIISSAMSRIGKGDPDSLLMDINETISDVLEKSESKPQTLDKILEEELQKIVKGEARQRIIIPLLSPVMGAAPLGEVVGLVGAPKFGKSFTLRQIRKGLSDAGIPTLTSQLELGVDQELEREVRSETGKFGEIDPKTAQDFLDRKVFASLSNAHYVDKADSIESCKTEVWNYLAKHPEIKVWLLDYNERIYTLDKGSSQYQEAQRVCQFVKNTAKKFDIVAIVLLQPNNGYHKDGANGPKPEMIDFGNKWVKDCFGLWFMHKPFKFDKTAPPDLMEYHLIAARGSADGVIYTKFQPEWSRFIIHPDSEMYARLAKEARQPNQPPKRKPTKGIASGGNFETIDDDDDDYGLSEQNQKAIREVSF